MRWRCAVAVGAWRATMSAFCDAAGGPLLRDMGELVREHLRPGGPRGVLPRGEDDIRADRVGVRADAPCGARRGRVGVHAQIAQVAPEARLEERALGARQAEDHRSARPRCRPDVRRHGRSSRSAVARVGPVLHAELLLLVVLLLQGEAPPASAPPPCSTWFATSSASSSSSSTGLCSRSASPGRRTSWSSCWIPWFPISALRAGERVSRRLLSRSRRRAAASGSMSTDGASGACIQLGHVSARLRGTRPRAARARARASVRSRVPTGSGRARTRVAIPNPPTVARPPEAA